MTHTSVLVPPLVLVKNYVRIWGFLSIISECNRVSWLRYSFVVQQPKFDYLQSFNRLIGLVDKVFTNGPGDLGSTQVASYQRREKWYLIPPCLKLSNIRYVSRVKWSYPGKGAAPSPTPRCSNYWKGSLLVVLNKRETTLLTYKHSHTFESSSNVHIKLYCFVVFFSHVLFWKEKVVQPKRKRKRNISSKLGKSHFNVYFRTLKRQSIV